MQPVTMTLPFSAMASPMASSDSALALSRKPQVLTMTTSAPSWLARQLVALGAQLREDALGIDQRLGQPSDTKETVGAVFAVNDLRRCQGVGHMELQAVFERGSLRQAAANANSLLSLPGRSLQA